MAINKHIICLAVLAACAVYSCQKLPGPVTSVVHLCPYSNPEYIIHRDNDSALYWIPNCFAPGDSVSPNDSLVEFERNVAQTVVTITDSMDNVLVYDIHNFQYAGIDSHTVWYGNYSGTPQGEGCYLLQVSGTTLFGTPFKLTGTVSLLRYFFGNDTFGVYNKVFVKCDSCFFNTQFSGSNFNPLLPNEMQFVQDKWHQCD